MVYHLQNIVTPAKSFYTSRERWYLEAFVLEGSYGHLPRTQQPNQLALTPDPALTETGAAGKQKRTKKSTNPCGHKCQCKLQY